MRGDKVKQVMAAELAGIPTTEAEKNGAVVELVEILIEVADSIKRLADAAESIEMNTRRN